MSSKPLMITSKKIQLWASRLERHQEQLKQRWEACGLPEYIVTDRAKEFKSVHLKHDALVVVKPENGCHLTPVRQDFDLPLHLY
ncbi:hypothetical protein H6F43_11600 [Leptolyngbya sp. FACHB-36]|uniref:hypothetical protein n=1 Tax=Leptolyngbya sp. FACHB-36 TaxID=2692808 RepID=UPI001681BA88|nr:hypothetical protein [Leptolyngbya sp. FACHB-36]MBD2020827.1 hypothetical protein [Leptolyngbya sp. FACHB-36]